MAKANWIGCPAYDRIIPTDYDNRDCFGRFLGGADGHLIRNKQDVYFLFHKVIHKASYNSIQREIFSILRARRGCFARRD